MAKLSDRFAALSEQQRELLARRLKEKGLDAVLAATAPVAERQPNPAAKPAHPSFNRRDIDHGMQFSIFFFSGDGSTASTAKYDVLLEAARFADDHGFAAVWTPERHFVDFGGLYPNPSVLSAALAVATKRVQIRAGSVALPLHHPIRVAEEWALVDNLSNGRVAISIASGWHSDDFILAPGAYENRRDLMYEYIATVQRLWTGEPTTFRGVDDKEVEVRVLPRPVQASLPFWVTTAGSPQTWVKAGEIGANILAALVGYSFDGLVEMIDSYRDARARNGHDPEAGIVSLMLHTYLGEDNKVIKEMVRAPMCKYLRTYMKQMEKMAADPENVTEADKESLVAFAFESYFDNSTLLGTVDKCSGVVENLISMGVDEVACLVDFGLDADTVLGGLQFLNELKSKHEKATNVGS